jgi:hypothetical protein
MVITIICVFLWIPDILKELHNVLCESVLKAYFFINIGFCKYSMSLTILMKFPDGWLNSLHVKA